MTLRTEIATAARQNGWATTQSDGVIGVTEYRRSNRSGPRAWSEMVYLHYSNSGALIQAIYVPDVMSSDRGREVAARNRGAVVLHWLRRTRTSK